jgi:hypothetical protein
MKQPMRPAGPSAGWPPSVPSSPFGYLRSEATSPPSPFGLRRDSLRSLHKGSNLGPLPCEPQFVDHNQPNSAIVRYKNRCSAGVSGHTRPQRAIASLPTFCMPWLCPR